MTPPLTPPQEQPPGKSPEQPLELPIQRPPLLLGRRVAAYLRAFLPAAVTIDRREQARAVIGAAIGLALAALLSRWLAPMPSLLPWLVAPVGASAVLVFAVPASPMAQPWAVIGGNTVSALAGIVCVNLLPSIPLAAAAAAGLAVALMFLLRCLHPPGGAMALTAVLLHATQPGFALFPAFVNSLLLVMAGIAYNTLVGRRYPHAQGSPAAAAASVTSHRFNTADMDAVLARYNQVLDISRDDLETLLQQAEQAAHQRLFGHLHCQDIMARTPYSVQFGTALDDAWALMQRHRIKALPVVDRTRRVVGIITRADFMRHADIGSRDGMAGRLRELMRNAGTLISNKPHVVGQIMTRRVRVVREDKPLLDLLPAFSAEGHHHLPVIDADNRLVGILTQSDFVRALGNIAIPPTP